MKIVFLNGGLANQMFQYVFYRFGQIMNPDEDWYFDDSFFFTNSVHNGYELKKVFGLNPRLLSEYFDDDVWEYMIGEKRGGKSIPQMLLENEIDIRMISEYDNWKQWNPFSGRLDQLDHVFEEWMVNMDGNIYFNGYGIDKKFFKRIEDNLRREFVFPDIDEERNLRYADEIRSTESCALHVRRGDYVKIDRAAPDDRYSVMIDELLKRSPDPVLFVFSDDLSYCEEHRKEMGFDKVRRVVFVEGNEGEKAFRDMQLMSLCKNMIVGNSSFSFMASLLNRESGITLNMVPR